jgi:hypothetical protein
MDFLKLENDNSNMSIVMTNEDSQTILNIDLSDIDAISESDNEQIIEPAIIEPAIIWHDIVAEDDIVVDHVKYIMDNNFSTIATLEKLEESDIDIIIDIHAKILLMIYYNYLEKLKLIDLIQLRNIKIFHGDNLYLFAVRCGNLEIMKYLEDNEFDTFYTNIIGDNAYLLAAKYGHLEIMKILETNGCDIHYRNNNYVNAWEITESPHIKIHLENLGVSIVIKNSNCILKHGYEFDCWVCRENIMTNQKYMECGFKHSIHTSCFNSTNHYYDVTFNHCILCREELVCQNT